MIKLTARQQEVLTLIKQNIEETGYPPTRAEIANTLGFRSANAAEEHLRALARKGAIEIVAGASRGIRLPNMHTDLGIPVIGRVAAGSPILAEEHIHDYCNIPAEFFSPSADYFLEVNGDSMIDAGIFDGDLLAVHQIQQASNGQIIVARIGEEVTVKRFHRDSGSSQVTLFAENENYSPIIIDMNTQEMNIEGLSVGVIRRS